MATKAQQVEEAQREQQQLGQGSTQGGIGVEPPPTYTAAPPDYTQHPPQPAQPGHYGQPTVVIQPAAVPGVQCFTEIPVRITCPKCHKESFTSTHYETGTLTFVSAIVMIFMGLWLGCCLIPFCMDAFKDVVHHCPHCRYYLGRYNRI